MHQGILTSMQIYMSPPYLELPWKAFDTVPVISPHSKVEIDLANHLHSTKCG